MQRRLLKTLIVLFTLQFPATTFAQTSQKPKLIVQTGHSSIVEDIKFSPDGKYFASAGDDGVIKLWEFATGRELRTFKGHTNAILTIAFSPDGKFLASGGEDKKVRLWDLETGKELKSYEGHLTGVGSVVFSPSGRSLLSSGVKYLIETINKTEDEQMIAWDVQDKEVIFNYKNPFSRLFFSPDGKTLAKLSDKTIKLEITGEEEQTFNFQGTVSSVAFVENGGVLASEIIDEAIIIWDVKAKKQVSVLNGNAGDIYRTTFSPDGKFLASGAADNNIKYWDIKTGKELHTFKGHLDPIRAISFSPDSKFLLSGGVDHLIKAWDLTTKSELYSLKDIESIKTHVLNEDGSMLAVGGKDGSISLWDLRNGKRAHYLKAHKYYVNALVFSSDSKLLASGGSEDGMIKIWDTTTGKEIKSFYEPFNEEYYDDAVVNIDRVTGEIIKKFNDGKIASLAFSPDGKFLASGGVGVPVRVREVATGKEIYKYKKQPVLNTSLEFSANGELLACGSSDGTVTLWEMKSGREIFSSKPQTRLPIWLIAINLSENKIAARTIDDKIELWDWKTGQEIPMTEKEKPWVRFFNRKLVGVNSYWLFTESDENSVKLIKWYEKDAKVLEMISLISLNERDWFVTLSNGRFDTNRNLEFSRDLHWIVPDAPFTPLPLEVFMRDYFEPNLLSRFLRCYEENSCETEFKTVRDLSSLNRTQPRVEIKEIRKTNVPDTVEVTVEAENVRGKFQNGVYKEDSGVFDLRLFRDGQMVGNSTTDENLRKTFRIYKDFNEELAVWREANDVTQFKGAIFDPKIKTNCVFKDGKVTCVFRDIRLPHNGEKQTEFSVYAFNSDRVKSNTDRKTFYLPDSISSIPKKGRAYLITIGVNASDNPRYNLSYAANDARRMQETVGGRLKAEVGSKYSEVILVPLISDAESGKESNGARKNIIRGVFSLLAGRREEVSKDVLEQIEKIDRIPAVELEDTLIIAFSGHGYVDRNGIFYMLPADMPRDIAALTTESLKHAISSDELSLWMRDITAQEMLMIVDACHSAAAVQGKDFKPGPMGSRGLGQLAYDKGIRILAATQSDNVALELEKLQHGLLSYVLVKEGIEDKKADTEMEFKQLSAAEWLGFAVKAVPRLYQDILAGKKEVLIDRKKIVIGQKGTDETIDLSTNQQKTSGVNLQQPALFDFRRKKVGEVLFNLP
jgi:WD40 repeat protein